MDNVQPDGDRNLQAYIVRIWCRETGGQWYFSVQDVVTGERQGFASLADFFHYFRQQTGDTAVNPRGPPPGTDSD